MKNNSGKTSMMLKSKFSNKVNSILNPNPKKGKSPYAVTRELATMTDAEKLQMFGEIISAHRAASEELSSYRYQKREKNRIAKLREAKGYKAKNKTSKSEWEAMQQWKAA